MEDRMMLAALNYCRELLHIQGFLKDAENDKIHTRIKKFQDKKQIGISEAQLMSVELKYNDNTKDEQQ